VTYLLDVNALLSLVHKEHEFHQQIAVWIRSLDIVKDTLATCSIAELGVVRILPQFPEADYTVEEAKQLLANLKATSKLSFIFLADHMGVDQLPRWVKNPKQTTDGHLAALAKAHGAVLATLDGKIPGAFVFPNR
jgi:predicted nucleic acid-binding protein